MKKQTIMLVDDDENLLEIYSKIFTLKGFEIVTFTSGKDAIDYMMHNVVSVVILDVIMPKMDGMKVLDIIKKRFPECEVIMLTAEGSISGAVEAIKQGAFSYLVKPADIDELISNVKKAEELVSMRKENINLKKHIEYLSSEHKLIGESLIAQNLRAKAKQLGITDSSILITGETGVGKEVVAKLIHENSKRANQPFVCINCAALNDNLIESELFGNEKGAYTGADKQRRGRFEIADGGTIFLDEIGELNTNMQVKLLRVLQEKKFERVGGSETIKSDFRLITATNKDLYKEVAEGRFRADLFYRINIVPIEVEPLRNRKGDITLLCQYFIDMFSKEMNKKLLPVDEKIIDAMNSYSWPGNIRELRNIVERLVVLALDDEISYDDLPQEIKHSSMSIDESLKGVTKSFEKDYIEKVIQENNGNITQAAKQMNIARKNLYNKINEYKIKIK